MKGDTEDGLGRGEDDVLDSHDATRFEDVVSRQDVRVEDEVVGLIPVVSLRLHFRSSKKRGRGGRSGEILTALAGAGRAARWMTASTPR